MSLSLSLFLQLLVAASLANRISPTSSRSEAMLLRAKEEISLFRLLRHGELGNRLQSGHRYVSGFGVGRTTGSWDIQIFVGLALRLAPFLTNRSIACVPSRTCSTKPPQPLGRPHVQPSRRFSRVQHVCGLCFEDLQSPIALFAVLGLSIRGLLQSRTRCDPPWRRLEAIATNGTRSCQWSKVRYDRGSWHY